jgi:acyl dehydratase
MRCFEKMSGDSSRVHCDDEFAKTRGYSGVIAYGGLMLAQLSNLLGTKLPGPAATSTAWSIKYHKPLYVSESAEIFIEVTALSAATGVVDSRFRIVAGRKLVATGTAQSIVPTDEIAT